MESIVRKCMGNRRKSHYLRRICMKKRVLSLAVMTALILALLPGTALAAAAGAGACGAEGDNIKWLLIGGRLTLSGSGAMEDYSAENPAPWSGYDVGSIAIWDGITEIGERAFRGCSGVTEVTVPDSVTRIGDGAFENCRSLVSVSLPATLERLGRAFEGCKRLADVRFAGSEEQWNTLTTAEDAGFPAWTEVRFGSGRFSDVAAGAWYADAVRAASEAGIVLGNGDGTFDPSGELTWAHTAAFAARLMQYRGGEHVYGAADQKGEWYSVYADYLKEKGVIDGVPSDPEAKITRADAAAIFAAVLGEDTEKVNDVPEGYFADVPSGAKGDAVYALAEAGIVNGKPANGTDDAVFGYSDVLLRSEAAAIVARMAGLAPLVNAD